MIQQRRQGNGNFFTNGLDTTMEQEGNEIRDHDSEGIIQSPNRRGALDSLDAV